MVLLNFAVVPCYIILIEAKSNKKPMKIWFQVQQLVGLVLPNLEKDPIL